MIIMKNIVLIAILSVLVFAACEKNETAAPKFREYTVSMGANSVNDIYYSLANGEVNAVNRSFWDIAFSVPLQTATILINEGAGVELYCVGDTNAWSSVDENTITNLKPRYNDESGWTTGAFNVNAAGFPNYGWGTYHAGNPDHNVGGDSMYVIKLSDASYKKLMIRVKLGANSANVIRWANLDGSNETVKTLSTAPFFNKKYFVYYSIVNQATVQAEPDMNAWDLLFTRYSTPVPMGPGVFIEWPVMGMLSNPAVTIAKVTGVAPESAVEADTTTGYSNKADAIGYDWKVSDPVTHVVSLVENTSYFVKSVDGKKYLLYFTNYGGIADGTITFKVKTVE